MKCVASAPTLRASSLVRKFRLPFFICALLLTRAFPFASPGKSAPVVVGAMRETMWEGKTGGLIDLDTLSGMEGMVGLGPLEGLRGELVIVDGVCYKSEIRPDGNVAVTRTRKAKAPFFGYSRVRKWKREPLPDSVVDMGRLEAYFLSRLGTAPAPFMFKVEAAVAEARIHVVNVPPGTKVRSPEDAHRGQEQFVLANQDLILVGFFSTSHQAVFTHHDTFLHIHALSARKDMMGHLDAIRFQPGKAWVSLPEG